MHPLVATYEKIISIRCKMSFDFRNAGRFLIAMRCMMRENLKMFFLKCAFFRETYVCPLQGEEHVRFI